MLVLAFLIKSKLNFMRECRSETFILKYSLHRLYDPILRSKAQQLVQVLLNDKGRQSQLVEVGLVCAAVCECGGPWADAAVCSPRSTLLAEPTLPQMLLHDYSHPPASARRPLVTLRSLCLNSYSSNCIDQRVSFLNLNYNQNR